MRDFADDAMPGFSGAEPYKREPWAEYHIPVFAMLGLKAECIVTAGRARDMPQNGVTFEEFKAQNPHPKDRSRCGTGCPHCRCRLNIESAFDSGVSRIRVLPIK